MVVVTVLAECMNRFCKITWLPTLEMMVCGELVEHIFKYGRSETDLLQIEFKASDMEVHSFHWEYRLYFVRRKPRWDRMLVLSMEQMPKLKLHIAL